MTPSFLDLPAAADLIADGDRIGVGGALFSRLPLALVGELIRRKRRDLTYVTWGGGLPLELLLQADAVRKVVFCFSSLDIFGLAPRFRRALEEGRVEVEELPALAMAQGFEAALQRLPSLPFQLPVGSDILDRSSLTRVSPDPVAGVPVGSAAALHLDSFLLHAQRADIAGNVELTGALGMDLIAPFAARNLVVSVEEIVPAGTLQANDAVTSSPITSFARSSSARSGRTRPRAFPTTWRITARWRAAFDSEPLVAPAARRMSAAGSSRRRRPWSLRMSRATASHAPLRRSRATPT